MRHRNRSRPSSVITTAGLWSLLRSYLSTRPTGGIPQHGEDEIEMVGVQASHETADIFEWLAKCEGFDECQNAALS
jgi:hypothetical protein